MNVALRKRMSLEEFLAWEDRQELRYEFNGFRPVAMTGGTLAHTLIQAGLIAALTNHLQGKPCRAGGSHMKLQVGGRIRYPEAFVICSNPPLDAKVVTDPVVVFEVLSDGSAADDLVTKNAEYRATPSIQRYVVLQQTRIAATVFSRRGDLWVTETLDGKEAILKMPEIGIAVPMAEIYASAGLPEAPEAEPA